MEKTFEELNEMTTEELEEYSLRLWRVVKIADKIVEYRNLKEYDRKYQEAQKKKR